VTPDLDAMAETLAADLATLHRAGRIACALRPAMRLAGPDGHRGFFYWRVVHASPPELVAVEEETAVTFRWTYHDDGWRVAVLTVATTIAGPAHGLVDSDWTHVPVTIHPHPGAMLDLSDPVTCAALLLLVREAWGDPTASTAATRESDGSRGWVMDCGEPRSPLHGLGPFGTEVATLCAAIHAAALEAAP